MNFMDVGKCNRLFMLNISILNTLCTSRVATMTRSSATAETARDADVETNSLSL